MERGAGSESSSSLTLSLDSRTMLVITNTATMKTAATLSVAASNAAWISRDSVIATWFRNCASPNAMTTTTTASHSRRFRTASSRVALASEATIGIGVVKYGLSADKSKLAQYVPVGA